MQVDKGGPSRFDVGVSSNRDNRGLAVAVKNQLVDYRWSVAIHLLPFLGLGLVLLRVFFLFLLFDATLVFTLTGDRASG